MDAKAEILAGKAVVLRHGDLNRVYEILGTKGKAAYQPDGSLAVQWTLDCMKVLRNLGYSGATAPSPISKNYTFPGLYAPMAHQRVTADFITMHKKCYVLSEQGTGKTMAAIWACDFLMRAKKINRVLIIAPLSVMKAAWWEDINKVILDMPIGICTGTRKQKEAVVNSHAKYVIIGYDSVATVQKALQNGGFDMVICDEATYLKSVKAQRSVAVRSLIKPETRVIAMTGTPAAQSPMDAHGILLLCRNDDHNIPRSMTAFRATLMDKAPYSEFAWTPKPDAIERVYKLLQPAIRFTKEECLDLPEQTYQTREVPMGEEQKKQYIKLKKEGILKLTEGNITAVNAGVMLTKLLQVAGGSVYNEEGDIVNFDASPRLQEVKDIIDGTAHKVIIFCSFKHSAQMVCNYLTKESITYDTISGAKTGTARADTITGFQSNKDPKVLVIQPKAASHGITLTAADTIIWFNPTLSTETFLQANARCHRQGQKNPCTVYMLVGSDVEKKCYASLDKNVNNQVNLLEMYKEMVNE